MDYPSNSRKEREEREQAKTKYHKGEGEVVPEKHLEKVISGQAIKKPKGVGHKFRTIFLGGDMKETVSYVNSDVLLPRLRELLWDLIIETSGQYIFGRNRRGRPEPRGQHRAYNRVPLRPESRESTYTYGALPDQRRPLVNRAQRDTDNVILPSREDVDFVLERMMDIVNQYEVASLADLNELIGAETKPLDNKWGWYRFTNIPVRQVPGGYLMTLPPMEEIDAW